MKNLLAIAVPTLVIAMMFIVGLNLTAGDFWRVRERPRAVVAGLVGQWLLIPMLALLLTRALSLPTATAAGILLLAICPGGGISNVYSYLARANTALSVTLTALSCLAAVVTMPLWLAGYRWLTEQPFIYAVPLRALALQLVLLIAVPIGLGMLTRRWRPAPAQRYEPLLRRAVFGAIACLLVFVIVEVRDRFAQELAQTVPLAIAFIGATLAAGLGVGRLCGLEARDCLTLAIEYPVRNLSIALVIAINVFDRVEFASFAAAYFLVEVAIVAWLVKTFARWPQPA